MGPRGTVLGIGTQPVSKGVARYGPSCQVVTNFSGATETRTWGPSWQRCYTLHNTRQPSSRRPPPPRYRGTHPSSSVMIKSPIPPSVAGIASARRIPASRSGANTKPRVRRGEGFLPV
ncbi:hypothetical protein NHX12_003442 [Muraenolepis orangiensis]|uniref:Uncharacterized protein n=1 Tax=Muraenolepis orangiensis TaxID=630683 RepID=A0A9Q0IE48_9TELE|nr:hypothetical protein NHX12_003442 [Muraenolepis orangiensis]